MGEWGTRSRVPSCRSGSEQGFSTRLGFGRFMVFAHRARTSSAAKSRFCAACSLVGATLLLLRFCRCYVFVATLLQFTNHRQPATSVACYVFGYTFAFPGPRPKKRNSCSPHRPCD